MPRNPRAIKLDPRHERLADEFDAMIDVTIERFKVLLRENADLHEAASAVLRSWETGADLAPAMTHLKDLLTGRKQG